MESVNRTFELKKQFILTSPSSIFSTDDVINILQSLKQEVLMLIDEEKAVLPEEPETFESAFTAFKQDVIQAFRNELDDNRYGDYVDQDSVEFNIGYDNRIELSNIDINADELENALLRAFDIVENSN